MKLKKYYELFSPLMLTSSPLGYDTILISYQLFIYMMSEPRRMSSTSWACPQTNVTASSRATAVDPLFICHVLCHQTV